MSEANRYAAPRAQVADVAAVGAPAAIASLPVSDKWKARFFAIDRAGGVKLPRFKELSVSQRMSVNFNFLAFLFGPVYYATKGMWRKGLALFGVLVVAVVARAFGLEAAGLGRLANALGYGAAAVYSVRANIDYYKKMVLGRNGWW